MRFYYISSPSCSKWLYLLFIPFLLLALAPLQAQQESIIFVESFNVPPDTTTGFLGFGLLGPCQGADPNTCEVFRPPLNQQWTITGDASGLTDSSFFLTNREGQLIATNIVTELCFQTSVIDISQFQSVGFTLNIGQVFGRDRTTDELERDSIIEDLLEDDDYVDIKYVLDGDTILIVNYEGEGSEIHTKVNDFGASVVTINNLQGRTLQILVCVRNNAANESIALDNFLAFSNVANPDLMPDCPISAILVLDESGSLFDDEAEVEAAAEAFVCALLDASDPGFEPSLAVIEFSNSAATVLGGGYNTVDAAYKTNFLSYLATNYNPGGGTNWTAALAEALTLTPPPDLLVFMSDGNPSFGQNGIAEANMLKSNGVHMYVVGVGSGISEPNLQSISGFDEDIPPAGTPPPFEEADYVITDFPGLEQVFEDIPKEICNSELQVTKTISGNQFCPPDTAVFTITIEDIMEGDGISANAVVLTDVIESGYTYISNNRGATFAVGTLTWNVGSIPDGGDTTITITVAVNDEPASHGNTATASAANAVDASDSILDTDISVGCTELEVVKMIDEMEFCPPDTAVFTIMVNDLPDTGNLDAENVVLTDIIENGYTYISNDQGASFDSGTNTLTWNIGTIPNGGSVQIQITVAVNAEPASHSNNATVSATNADGDASGSINDADIIVGCTELEVLMTIDEMEFCPPDTTFFTILVNDLPDPNSLDAENVLLTDVIGDGYTYISNDQSASFDSGTNTLTWNIGTIPNGGSEQIQIMVAVNDETADHGSVATASADNAAADASDNIDDGDVVVGCTELQVTKNIFGREFCPPDTTFFTVTVTDLPDPNNLDAQMVVLKDTIKDGYTYISNDQGATFVDSILTWNIGTIPNNGNATIIITVAVNPEPADHANYATASADNALEDARDGFSGSMIHVRCCPKGGGQIGYNQTLCGNGNDPDLIVGLADPDWAAGEPLVYAWLRRPAALGTSGQWTPISGANQASYDPGPLSESTYFVRCVRSQNTPECPHQESNIVLIEVDDVAVASISGPLGILCNNQTYTFSTPQMNDIQNWHYTWDLGAGASPRYLHGHQVQVSFTGVGVQTIKLNVERQGCVASDQLNVFVTNSSQLCGSSLISNPNAIAEFVSIYPNPARDKVFFELPVDKPLSGEVRLLQLDGKVLYTRNITNEVFRQSIDLSTYEAGIYFIQIRMEEGLVFTEKVVKQ